MFLFPTSLLVQVALNLLLQTQVERHQFLVLGVFLLQRSTRFWTQVVVENCAEVLDGLLFEVGIVSLKNVLLPAEVEVQDNLFLEVGEHFVSHLVGHVDSVVDGRMARLELVESSNLLLQVLGVKEVLALVGGVLNHLQSKIEEKLTCRF
jgi:hypothetical protein